MNWKEAITPNEKASFAKLINSTKSCLRSKGISTTGGITDDQWRDAINCETAIFSTGSLYTYHTHPNGDPEPSEPDRRTTAKHGKQFMFIGLVPTNEVVVYGAADGYRRLLGRFKV
ncbi:MAG: Mov34/MPN/PAD-1 family protein [Pirellulales bacterium]|nr:Mov34/MPN/PAD-1 family protein [Pirellulales bacterium]